MHRLLSGLVCDVATSVQEEIDEKSLEAGSRVSGIRVSLSLIIDAVIVRIPYALSKTQLPFSLFLALYFSLIPLLNGKTFGSALLKFGLTFENKNGFAQFSEESYLRYIFASFPQACFT